MSVKSAGKTGLLGITVFATLLAGIALTLAARIEAMGPPQTLASPQWSFDFQQAERILQGLEHHPDAGLVLNHPNAERLQRAANTLPLPLTENDRKRVAFLSQLGFPPREGEQVADTLTETILYLQARRSAEAALAGDASLAAAESRFAAAVALQDQFFGENRAQQLFSQRRQLQGYLLERQKIQSDPELGEQQRQQALADASRRFRAARAAAATP